MDEFFRVRPEGKVQEAKNRVVVQEKKVLWLHLLIGSSHHLVMSGWQDFSPVPSLSACTQGASPTRVK